MGVGGDDSWGALAHEPYQLPARPTAIASACGRSLPRSTALLRPREEAADGASAMTIESTRRWCLALPGVTEDIKWDDDLVFSVGGKMFCVAMLEPPHRVSFKCDEETFAELIEREGIIPAPYWPGRSGCPSKPWRRHGVAELEAASALLRSRRRA